jgi:hypothetical protein
MFSEVHNMMRNNFFADFDDDFDLSPLGNIFTIIPQSGQSFARQDFNNQGSFFNNHQDFPKDTNSFINSNVNGNTFQNKEVKQSIRYSDNKIYDV